MKRTNHLTRANFVILRKFVTESCDQLHINIFYTIFLSEIIILYLQITTHIFLQKLHDLRVIRNTSVWKFYSMETECDLVCTVLY